MNLTKNPTAEELSKLLGSVDDNAGHHVLWVDHAGEVHVDLEQEFDDNNPQLRFRYETYLSGNEYVGEKAVADRDYVEWLLGQLVEDWNTGETGYVDA